MGLSRALPTKRRGCLTLNVRFSRDARLPREPVVAPPSPKAVAAGGDATAVAMTEGSLALSWCCLSSGCLAQWRELRVQVRSKRDGAVRSVRVVPLM